MERQIALQIAARPAASARRGVILLVILSLLTLFMMLGATYLVIASRARATARAFAIATNGSRTPLNARLGESLVDEAFLAVVRGSSTSTVTTGSNSLLGDKYGTTAPIQGTITSTPAGTLVMSFRAATTGTSVEQLNGRVLTFQTPSLNSASVRILRAEPVAGSTDVKLFIQDGPTLSGVNLSSATIASSVSGVAGPHFIVNGREFIGGSSGPNEPYDAYDPNNDFLANPLSPATRPSFSLTTGTSGTNLKIDNDGDGVLDSGWVDAGLPPFADANGNLIYPKAAILITDLDGRLNVNAHGSRSRADYASGYPSTLVTGSNGLKNVGTSASSFSATPFSGYPGGFGFGPAETSLDQTVLFPGASLSPTTASSWSTLTEGIASSGTLSASNAVPPPNLGAVEGRYGSYPTVMGLPGKPNVNDPATAAVQAWIATQGSAYFTNPSRYGSPPDVRGRMKVFLDDYGQPVYYKPYWSGTLASVSQDEVVDDPYEVNLFRNSPRPGWLVNPATRNADPTFDYSNVPDNLFSAADLEGLLRILDPDARTLPQRLVALSGTQAAVNRLLLTTDSWDSSAMTGSIRDHISTLISSATSSVALTGTNGFSAYEMFAPETLMGHKFDLNRPFHNTDPTEPNDAFGAAERQKFAKHLYSLLYVITGTGGTVSGTTAQQLAQWAVNVVDFRDRDSIMTGFEYDKDLTNGWTADGVLTTGTAVDGTDRDVVWGSERPEILISEALCWHDRQTDDLTAGGGKVVAADPTKRDNDLDQQRRPQGAFFFELYSPWGSQLAQYDQPTDNIRAVRATISGSSSSLRAEPIPAELATGAAAMGGSALPGEALGRFDPKAALNLSGTAPDGSPFWRVVTVKTAASIPTVTDPAVTVSGSAWRSFYFTQPPPNLVRSGTNGDVASGTNAVAFWPSTSATTTISLLPQTPKVFGTGTSTALGGPAATVAMDTIFLSATSANGTAVSTKAATLTEPLITLGTNASYDAYAVLSTQSATGTATFPLATANDTPLDDLTFPPSGITSQLLGPDNKKTLFQNGRHSNYFLLHLQRLAHTGTTWNNDSNPYVTVDTLPVDLFVFNTDSTGGNHDEPTSAPDGFTYSFDGLPQRNYDDGESSTLSGAAVTVSLERGNTQASGTSDHDIWSARINTSGTNDAGKLLSIQSTTPTAARPAIDWSSGGDGTLLPSGDVPSKSNHTLGSLGVRFTGTNTNNLPDKPFPWMFWANRPFNSPAELAFVPITSQFQLLRIHATANPTGTDKLSTGWFGHLPRIFEPTVYDSGTTALASPWQILSDRNATSGSSNSGNRASLWDAVNVPTPFGGYGTLSLSTGTAATTALQPLHLDKHPYGQLPTFREPGRVNVNTITGSTTWFAVLGSGTDIATSSGSFTVFDPPARSFMDVLQKTVSVSGTTFIDNFNESNRRSDKNAFFRYQTVTRVANAVTTRSNVFAVWITVGFFDASGNEYGYDTGDIRRYRGFYIYDRSMPVGYSPGKDYNVRDAIVLRRVIP